MRRKNRKSSEPKSTGKDKFLSQLPEVEADIAYRFSFSIVGDSAERIAQSACYSHAALSLPGGKVLSGPVQVNPNYSRDSSIGYSKFYRCLCPVSSPSPEGDPGGLSSGKDSPPLAKLAFHVLGPGQDVPLCKNWLEASSTLLVFILILDKGGDLEYLNIQLFDAARQADRCLAESSPPPRCATLLCFEEGAEPSWQDRRWESCLQSFEQQHGWMCKVGPLQMADADALHRAFAELASNRIIRERGNTGRGVAGKGEQDDDDPHSVAHVHSYPGAVFPQQAPVFEAEYDNNESLADTVKQHLARLPT